jgi:inner membrane transporter RhtA
VRTKAAFTHPVWLLWGIGVGVSSSVILYVTDRLAMARLARATFSLIALVILGVALHRDAPEPLD